MSSNQSKPVNKFTAGPWAVKVDSLGIPHVVAGERVLFLGLQTVGVKGSLAELPEGEVLANAELAVAAPDLLAALEKMVELADSTASWIQLQEFLLTAKAAIDKARGEG